MTIQIVKTLDSSQELARLMDQGLFLIAAESPVVRQVTMNQLRQMGARHFFEATDGVAALKVLASQPITLLVADWQMQGMNGFDLLLSVRSSPELFTLPMILLTGDADRERISHAIHVGVSELLIRPYTSAQFAERIKKLFAWKPRRQTPIDPMVVASELGFKLSDQLVAHASTQGRVLVQPDTVQTAKPESLIKATSLPAEGSVLEAGVEKMTILVVDDTPDNLTLLGGILKDDYRVKIAHNGDRALKICFSDDPPDLVLMDIMMPGMNGFEATAALRAHRATENVPVMFVTALSDEQSRLKAMELGAVDFIVKPVNPVDLKLRIKNFLRYVLHNRALQADYDTLHHQTAA